MSRIDFYILKDGFPDSRLGFVCRLVEKVYRKGHRILLHTDDDGQAAVVDDMLWTWRQGSFIPHEVYAGDTITDCPVVISDRPEYDADVHDVLINLASDVPLFFERFERVSEVVDGDEVVARMARQRYRFYRERGYSPESHDMS